MLDAAAELDADPRWLIDERLPVVATLVFAGLRVHELTALRRGDLDFTSSTIHVRHSKTPAGIREIEMLPALKVHLLRHRDRGEASLPPGIGPHSLRHTFASLLLAIGESPLSVMRQLGHTDPAFTLRVYAHSMVGGPDERERLRELAEGYEVVGETSREFERHGVDPLREAE